MHNLILMSDISRGIRIRGNSNTGCPKSEFPILDKIFIGIFANIQLENTNNQQINLSTHLTEPLNEFGGKSLATQQVWIYVYTVPY